MLLVFTTILILHLIGAIFPIHYFWGFNFWGYFYSPLSFVIPGIAIFLLFPPINNILSKFLNNLQTPLFRLFNKINHYVLTIILSLILFLLFYLLRSKAHIYGDGFMVLTNHTSLDQTIDFSLYYMKPLVILFHRTFYSIISHIISAPAENILAAINAVGGVLGFWALNRISKLLSTDNNERWFILFGALSSGSLILFFGYIENYTWATALSLWSLAFSLGYLKGINNRWLSVMLGLLAVGFHVFSIPFLIIALLVFFTNEKGSSKSPLNGSISRINLWFIVLSIVFVFIIQFTRFSSNLVPLIPLQSSSYWFLGWQHLIDVCNQFILTAPLGIVVFIYLIWWKFKTDEKPQLEQKILSLLSLMLFLEVFWINPHLGAARDWDLLSFIGFPFSIWGAYLLYKKYKLNSYKAKYLVSIVIVTLICIIPNLIEKNNLQRAIAHLDDALWQDAHYQIDYRQAERSLTWGYTLTFLAGDPDRAIKHFHRRLKANPDSYQALLNLGKVYSDKNMIDSMHLYHTLAGKIDKRDFTIKSKLAYEAVQLNNFTEALEYALQAEQLAPDNAIIQTQLATINSSLGRDAEALKHFHNAHRLAPQSCGNVLNLGMYFNSKGMHDSAFFYLDKMLSLKCSNSHILKANKTKFNSLLSVGNYNQAQIILNNIKSLSQNPAEINHFRKRLEEAIRNKSE